MKKILFSFSLLCGIFFASAQTTTLSFTGRDANNNFLRMNRVVITNISRNWQETIYYPDTVLVMGTTDIDDYDNATKFGLTQNTPNPFSGTSDFCISLPQEGTVSVKVMGMDGREFAAYNNNLPMGKHTFRIMLSVPQTYIVIARFANQTSSIKIVNEGNAGTNSLQYLGNGNPYPLTAQLESTKGQSTHDFHFGDMMVYMGYAIVNGVEYTSQMIQQQQLISESLVLNFDVTNTSSVDGQPCRDAATVTDYDGNVYATVQLGTQCWMKENLRTTHYANGTSISLGYNTSSTTAHRYYPDEDASNVPSFGYLYNWAAVMGNFSSSTSNPSNVQGICPDDWHVPSNAEWAQLTDYVSSQIEYICGNDEDQIAKALTSADGWRNSTTSCAVGNDQSSNNTTGFSAVPAGKYTDRYIYFGSDTHFWSCTKSTSHDSRAIQRGFLFSNADISRSDHYKYYGYSVRCVRD